MAKDFSKSNVKGELKDQLNRDLNIFVRQALVKLSREQDPYSPIDTGFFASSWKASRTRPRPQDARESFAPWSNIKPTRKGQKSSEARIEPRFIDKINYNFNIYEKVFIGNTSKYAAFALASDRSRLVRYFKADIKQDIDSIFKEKKPKIGLATQPFKGGQGGIGQFADPTKTFVEYTDL